MNKKILILTLALIPFLMSGCGKDINPTTDQKPTPVTETKPSATSEPAMEVILEKISADKAKEMMDASKELILLDVRTPQEYEEGHIEGALLIPDFELASKAEELLTDKDATILLYCRSGRRSAEASQTLSDLGYTKIYDFGGIIDWPYEIVTE